MTWPIVVGVAVAAMAIGAVAFIRAARSRIVVRVQGDSMLPTLRDGDRLIARRHTGGRIDVGDIVVFARPPLGPALVTSVNALPPWWIKRVAAVPGDPVPASVPARFTGRDRVPPGYLVVLGDAPGLDSRAFGLLPMHLVLGVARSPAPRPHAGVTPSASA